MYVQSEKYFLIDHYIPPGCSNANADVESFHAVLNFPVYNLDNLFRQKMGALGGQTVPNLPVNSPLEDTLSSS